MTLQNIGTLPHHYTASWIFHCCENLKSCR